MNVYMVFKLIDNISKLLEICKEEYNFLNSGYIYYFSEWETLKEDNNSILEQLEYISKYCNDPTTTKALNKIIKYYKG